MTAGFAVHLPFTLREALEFAAVYVVVVLALCWMICGTARVKR